MDDELKELTDYEKILELMGYIYDTREPPKEEVFNVNKKTFRRFAKVEAKRLVKRMHWEHDPDKRAVARLKPYVCMVTKNPDSNDCGWMLAIEMEKKSEPGTTDSIKPIASNTGCHTVHEAKQQCEGALIRVVFEDILREEVKRARNPKKRETDRQEGTT
ncbi:MAG: hypothetical protein ACTSXE_02585 [Candidatus Thorarchaeota archaeon]